MQNSYQIMNFNLRIVSSLDMYVPYLVLILIPTARPFIDPFSEYLLTSTKLNS